MTLGPLALTHDLAAPTAPPRPAVLFRPGPVVHVRCTDLAPGGLWRRQTFFGPPPRQLAREIADRLCRRPEQLSARAMAMGDVAIMARLSETDVEGLDADPPLPVGAAYPFAFADGDIDAETLNAAFAQAARQ